MSGHSKWANIKHRKEATDKKRAQQFSKIVRAISIIAKTGGSQLESNPTLRSAVERARKAGVPQDNIERAIKKSQEENNLHALLMEAYGPEGVAIIIGGASDNSNRTVSEIKKILKDHNAKWANPGSVLWAFTVKEGEYIPNFPQAISERAQEELQSLMEALDDHDDVHDIYVTALLDNK